MLGAWLSDARRKAKEVGGDVSNFLFNAKNQITLWGPHGEINDYSTRQWNGCVGDYDYHRWDEYLKVVEGCVIANTTVEMGDYRERMMQYGWAWDHKDDAEYPNRATGNFIVEGNKIQAKYLRGNVRGKYDRYVDMSVKEEDIYFRSVSHNPEILGYLCNLDPWCVGFTTEGHLFHKATLTLHRGSNAFVKLE